MRKKLGDDGKGRGKIQVEVRVDESKEQSPEESLTSLCYKTAKSNVPFDNEGIAMLAEQLERENMTFPQLYTGRGH